MSIYNIPAIVASCLPRSATPSNVIAGFKAIGIYPFDRNNFTQSDFAPGLTTDHPMTVKEHVNASHAIVKSPHQTTSQSSEKPITSSINESPSLPSESQEPTSISEPLVSVSNVPESSSATKDSQSSFVPPITVRPFQKTAPRPNVKPKRRIWKSPVKNLLVEEKRRKRKTPSKKGKRFSKKLFEENSTQEIRGKGMLMCSLKRKGGFKKRPKGVPVSGFVWCFRSLFEK